MSPVLIYLLKVNIAIALFLLFYRLFFSGDTFWKARRVYLIASVVIAFLYPLFSIQAWWNESTVVHGLAVEYIELQELVVTPANTVVFPWKSVLLTVYFSVVAGLLIRMLAQLLSILRIHFRSQRIVIQGVKLHNLSVEITPFSFFGAIYLNPSLHSDEELRQILTHELAHVRQWHSLDVILAELLCVGFWMNPFMWMLRREIRQNLEYLADDKVVASGVDSRHYQYHLLRLSCHMPDFQLTNKFNISPLKKRIRMMNQPRSSKTTALKYLLIAPLSFSLVVLSNAETFAASLSSLIHSPVISLESETDQVNVVLPVSDVSDNKPENSQKVNSRVTESKDGESTKPTVTTVINSSELKLVGVEKIDPSRLNEITVVGYAPEQSNQHDDNLVFTVVEEMPQFVGGDQELYKYLASMIQYPVAAQQKGVQGRVVCQFIIDRNGKVTEPSIVRGVATELDAEAIRVILGMPSWKPGKQKGKTVNVKYTLPINFRLQGKSTDNKVVAQLKKNPVIVIDGDVKVEGFDLNNIKPEEIEEITVLKQDNDPAQKEKLIKQYGERAADGVILIKMKK